MTEAELNKRHYVKTLKPVSSLYVNTLSPKKELEIVGDFIIVKSWNSVPVSQQKMLRDHLGKSAEALGVVLDRLLS